MYDLCIVDKRTSHMPVEDQNKNILKGLTLDLDNREFNNALDLVENTSYPVIYLTGKAGTGKTTFLKYLQAASAKKMVVLAPTGVAAVNAEGQTIHSFFQITPGALYVPGDKRFRKKPNPNDPDKSTVYDNFKYGARKLALIRSIDLLVIDEISMVRADLLDAIDTLLRIFRRNDKPFGGVQTLLIGDTFQLPPIANNDERTILSRFYDSVFFFDSLVIKQSAPIYIELKKIYRQKDPSFIDLLNKVRVNQLTEGDIRTLNAKVNRSASPKDNSIILATRNAEVDSYNEAHLEALNTDLKTFYAEITGSFPAGNYPTDEVLRLKVGAQVMMRRNHFPDYYNGTIGTIRSINENIIIVETNNGEIAVQKETWNNIRYEWDEETESVYEMVVGQFTQWPLKLAWAITVHKSQGLTFENVVADLGSSFSAGQVYVALSRCTSFEGLVLKSPIERYSIKTDPNALAFARTETPDTIVNETITEGKADFFYKKAREAFRNNNLEAAIEYFQEAVKYRCDIATPTFKRYCLALASRLFSKLRDSAESEEIEALRKDRKDLKEAVIEKEKDIMNLEEHVTLLTYSNETLENQIQTLNKKLTNVSEELRKANDELERIHNMTWWQRLRFKQ